MAIAPAAGKASYSCPMIMFSGFGYGASRQRCSCLRRILHRVQCGRFVTSDELRLCVGTESGIRTRQ